ncbi:MAG: DUF4340 domain-containing protein [Phycisphaerales bacterium]|nr:DUF4340 domain-containing protein [Phycisphaerales bacterium]
MSARRVFAAWLVALVAWLLVWGVMTAQSARSRTDGSEAGNGFAAVYTPGSVPWESVDRIEVSRGDLVAWQFLRRDGQWRQSQPFDFPLEGLLVEEILDTLRTLDARAAPEGSGSSADSLASASGISNDSPRVTVGWNGGSAALALGRRLPAGCAWIAPLKGDRLPRVARATVHDAFLGGDLRRLRRTALFERADVECQSIASSALASDGSVQHLEVLRDEASPSSWRIAAPVSTRADREAVERWLDALARARATGFVVDSPTDRAAFGLDEPLATVQIRSSVRSVDPQGQIVDAPRVERLEIGAPVRAEAPERFARLASHPEAIMEIDEAAVAAAMPPALSLVDATATGLRPADIRGVRLEPGDASSARLERAAGDWMLVDTRGTRAADARAVEGLLARLCSDRATEIAQGAPPTELLLGRIVVEGFDGREIASLAISREVDGGRFGIDDGSGILRIFPRSTSLFLEAEDYEVRDPAATRVSPPVVLPR